MATLKLGKEPGVYSQEEINPALAITQARLKVAGLVGHSTPTLTVSNIAVTRGTGDADTLDYAFTNVAKILSISDYLNANGTNLPQYATDDYTLEQGADQKATIKWAGDTKPTAGNTYYVNAVIKKDASYYVPKKFADAISVKAYYGPEWYTKEDGTKVVNEISLAARLMFNNGANEIWICEAALGDNGQPSEENIKNAITLLDDIELQSIVVTYMTKTIQDFLKTRVVIDSATENQRERVGFVCALSDEVDAIVTQSSGLKEQRIVNVAPSKVTVIAEDNQGNANEFTVSSTFAAAACVGALVDNSRPVSMPLTRFTPVGIYGVSKVYTRPEIEKLSAAGTFVIKERDNNVLVNQSVTTDNTNQNNRELSVVLIKDEVLKDLRYNLDRDYIGKYFNRKTTPTKIKTSIVNILTSYLDTLIEDFDESNIIVTPDGEDTTRVNVRLAFSVLRPLNYIYISFQVVI